MLGLPRTYWFLWSGLLVNRLGGFVVPFLTLYLTGERGMSPSWVGLVVALYGAGAAPAGPLGGVIADRFGRRGTMLASSLLSAAAMVQLGLARAPLHIAASTLALGFLAELFRPAANATVVDLVPPASRTRAFGYLYWASNLGFAGACAVAGLLAEGGFTWLFVGDAVTTLVMAAVLFVGVPESHPAGAERRSAPRPDFTVPYRDRRFLRLVVAQLLVATLFMQFNSSLPLDMRAHGVGPSRYGPLVALNGVLIVLLQPLSVELGGRHRRHHLMALGAVLTAAGFGLTALASTPLGYALTIAIWTVGEIIFSPVTPAIVGDLAPPELRGTYQGALMLSFSLAVVVGNALGPLVLSRLGSATLWIGCAAVGLVAAAIHLGGGDYGDAAARSPARG